MRYTPSQDAPLAFCTFRANTTELRNGSEAVGALSVTFQHPGISVQKQQPRVPAARPGLRIPRSDTKADLSLCVAGARAQSDRAFGGCPALPLHLAADQPLRKEQAQDAQSEPMRRILPFLGWSPGPSTLPSALPKHVRACFHWPIYFHSDLLSSCCVGEKPLCGICQG